MVSTLTSACDATTPLLEALDSCAARPTTAASETTPPGAIPDADDAEITIAVHVHNVYSRAEQDLGWVDDDAFEGYVRELNRAFAGETGGPGIDSRIRFRLDSVDHVDEFSWLLMPAPATDAEVELKQARRRGGAASLNIYTGLTLLAGGWGTFPQDYAQQPWWDGVTINFTRLPGQGNRTEADLLTHEVGHWLGLYHVFEAGFNELGDDGKPDPCRGDGDRVADTAAARQPPQEMEGFVPILLCPETPWDSCPDEPGLDPIENFMNYTSEDCTNHFTAGQVARMRASYWLYRGPSAGELPQ